jgi:hypothetical protein
MFRFLVRIIIGFVAVVLTLTAAQVSMVVASAAGSVKHGEITVKSLGVNSKNIPRFKVRKTKKAPRLINVVISQDGVDFKRGRLSKQTQSVQNHKGTMIPDGLSQVATVAVYDPSAPKGSKEIYFEQWTIRNWKSMKKSCSRTNPTIVVNSSATPSSTHLRVYKRRNGKVVGKKTVAMIRAGREGNDAFYALDPKKMKGGWKAGKMVTRTKGYSSLTCLTK